MEVGCLVKPLHVTYIINMEVEHGGIIRLPNRESAWFSPMKGRGAVCRNLRADLNRAGSRVHHLLSPTASCSPYVL
jgi:hypothetical protein